MLRYFTVRFLHGLFLLVGVSVLTFALLQLAPGDFFTEMRLNPQMTPESVAALRHQYGLDRPVATRYLLWIDSVRKGELGFSFAYDSPVASLLWARARNTLVLTLSAMLLSWLIAVPVGVGCAARPGRWSDRLCLSATSSLLAIPDLLLALGLLFLAVRTGWFPTGGMVSLGFEELSGWGKVRDVASHFCLPGCRIGPGYGTGAGAARARRSGGSPGLALHSRCSGTRHPAPPAAVTLCAPRRCRPVDLAFRSRDHNLAQRLAFG